MGTIAYNKDYCVYVLTDPRKPGDFLYGDDYYNERPFYVGQGLTYRWDAHEIEARRSPTHSSHKLNVIRKILRERDSYTVWLVGTGLTRQKALDMEIEFIARIGRHDLGKGPLTNLTDGGDGGVRCIRSERTRTQQGRALSKRWQSMTPDERSRKVLAHVQRMSPAELAERARIKSEAAKKMHARYSASKKADIYFKASESQRKFLASLVGEERTRFMEVRNRGKAESIRRIHAGYLRVLRRLLPVCDFKTFQELRVLLPEIPRFTLNQLLREFAEAGRVATRQFGANKPKQYLLMF